MDFIHDLCPETFVEFTVALRKLRVCIIRCPDGSGIIWCKACKDEILGLVRRTGFSGCVHIVEAGGNTGTFFQNILHDIGEEEAVLALKTCVALFSVLSIKTFPLLSVTFV